MKQKNKSRLMFLAIFATIILSISSTFVLRAQDSHHFNLDYRLWKLGLGDWNPKFGPWLMIDHGLKEQLKGKSVEDIQQLIPVLHDDPQNLHQKLVNTPPPPR